LGVASALLLIAVAPAAAATSGFAFLEVPVGARAAALGGAFTSLSDGAESMFWNVAGVSATKKLEVTASHSELLLNLRHEGFAVAFPAMGGGLGASVRALYTEPITERDELGNEIGTFGSHDLEFSIAHGRKIGEAFSAGVSAQIVRERIASYSTTTWSVGFGGGWSPPSLPGVRAALAVEHLGPAAHYDIAGSQGDPVELPAAVQGGFSYSRELQAVTLRGGLEGRWTSGRTGIGMLGAELDHSSGAALRAGYRANDDATTFSAGAGWRNAQLALDYAWVPYQLDLGDAHRFSITARF
jgi:hypothetical protein